MNACVARKGAEQAKSLVSSGVERLLHDATDGPSQGRNNADRR